MNHETLIINNPLVDLQTLVSEEESRYTYLHCSYTTSPRFDSGWWVNISITSYLKHRPTGESLPLLEAINIPLAPKKHYLKKFGDTLNFVLVFPPVPEHWKVFDFIEDSDEEFCLKAFNIQRNNIGVYKVVVK